MLLAKITAGRELLGLSLVILTAANYGSYGSRNSKMALVFHQKKRIRIERWAIG
jgi:hypothetical protein